MNPFSHHPYARQSSIAYILSIAVLAYALWAVWPVFSLLWMLVMW